jgi:hypothetical protein
MSILQTVLSLGHVALPPAAHRLTTQVQCCADLLIILAHGGSQNDLGALHQTRWQCPASGEAFEIVPSRPA